MKPDLHTLQHQHLVLTPQLQQAIRLLQLSTQDLKHELVHAVEANPFLELADDTPDERDALEEKVESSEPNEAEIELDLETQIQLVTEEFDSEVIGEDFYFDNNSGNQATTPLENQGANKKSLADHLLWQMRLSHFSEVDTAIATAIIDAIDDDGFLTLSVEEIRDCISNEIEIELDEVIAVLHRIQSYDPTGVGARNLSECLLLQLQQLSPDTFFLAEAKNIIRDHLELLAQHDYRHLKKATKLDDYVLSEVIKLIQTLNPKPGRAVTSTPDEYIVPDLIVTKEKGRWVVRFNNDALPRLKINTNYAQLLQQTHNGEDNRFINSHLQEARWLLKSISSRNETLLNVALRIVEHQQEFLTHGAEAMKPLILQDIATELAMHESTISRITTQKYMLTPRGVFELKYFFSSHVNTEQGDPCSSTAIRAFIKKMIGSENPVKPLSDSKIANLLAEQGIKVARRTVAKYRESLGIAPSHERKHLT